MGYDSNSVMCVTIWAVPYSTRNCHGLSNDTCDAHEREFCILTCL